MSEDTPTNSTAEPAQVKPFGTFLQETNRGRTHAELSEGLQELAQSVLDTGKAGTLTLTVKMSLGERDSRRLEVKEVVKVNCPAPEPKKSIFWADGANNLVRSDPTQIPFKGLEDVSTTAPLSAGAGTVRAVNE